MRSLLMFVAGVLFCGVAARGDVLYDNSSLRADPERFADSDYEFGEEILLAGNGTYTVTNFQYEYFGYGSSFAAGQVMVTLRFYLNDGPMGEPRTLLYDTGYYPIPATSSAGSVIEYGGLNVAVPKSFTWAVDFVGVGAGGVGLQSAGLGLYGVPTVGLTYDDYWEHSATNGGWELRAPLPGQPPINFGAKVEGTYTGHPAVTVQPVGGEYCPGAPLNLSVTAIGSAPLAYQWYHGGYPLSGANSSNYTVAALTVGDAGNYSVQVSNGAGSTNSATVLVIVTAPPVFTTSPNGTDACPGDTVVLTGVATGTAPLTYQWLKGGNPISGATLPTLTLSGVTAADAGTYVLRASNCGGDTLSAAAVVTVKTIVPMTGVVVYDNTSTRAQPERFAEADFEFGDEIILAGNGVWTITQFSFEYFGYGPDFDNGNVRVKVRFYRNDGLSSAPGTELYNSGFLAVPATSSAGSVVSLSGLSVSVPRNFTWSVEFIGIGPGSGAGTQAGGLDLYGPPTIGLNYDDYWERSGPGLTWVLRGPQPGQPPVSFGARAVATVTGTPYIIQQPADVVACRGDTVTLAAQVVASTTLKYQWFFGISPLAGQTNETLVIPFVDTANVGNYSVRAISCLGTVYSLPASVALRDPGQTSPCLHVARGVTPGTAVVSWTSFYGAGWRLEETTALSLGPSSTWVNTSGTPVLSNGEYSLTVPTSGSTRFFRLVSP